MIETVPSKKELRKAANLHCLCIINCTIPYSLCLNVVFYVKTKSKHINGTEELVLCCYVFFSARDSIHFTSSNKLVGLRWSKTLSL